MDIRDMDAKDRGVVGLIDALRRGAKIDAIRELRVLTGLGLKEAKDIIEAAWVVPHGDGTYLALAREFDAWQEVFRGNEATALNTGSVTAHDRDCDVIVVKVVAKTMRALVKV